MKNFRSILPLMTMAFFLMGAMPQTLLADYKTADGASLAKGRCGGSVGSISDNTYNDSLCMDEESGQILTLNFSQTGKGHSVDAIRVWNNQLRPSYSDAQKKQRMGFFNARVFYFDGNGILEQQTFGQFKAGLNTTETANSTHPLGTTINNVQKVEFYRMAAPNRVNKMHVREIQLNLTELDIDLETKISVSANENPTAPGETVTCTLTVENKSTHYAQDVAVTSALPINLTAITDNGVVTQGSYNDVNGYWNIGNLKAGEIVTLTLKGTVGRGDEVVCSTLRATGAGNDPTTASDILNASIPVEAAEIFVEKTSDATEPVGLGDVITYSYRIENKGTGVVTDVTLVDDHNGISPAQPIPSSEQLVTDIAPLGDSSDATIDGRWDTLGPGDIVEFTAQYQVTVEDIENLQ